MIMRKIKKPISELRQDLVSGDWVLIAEKRGHRSKLLKLKREKKEFSQPKKTCPFENPQKSGNDAPIIFYPKNKPLKNWKIQIIPNKFPAMGHGACALINKEGPYQFTDGYGFHEIVITKDHKKHLALLKFSEIENVIRSYQERFQTLKIEDWVKYILIFHNHGKEAGATISHPHSQIMTFPVIPPDVAHSLKGSLDYYNKHKKCVHCIMIAWELKHKKRVIFENKDFVAFTPFAPRAAFEIRIFPKKHESYFETMKEKTRKNLTEILKKILEGISKGLRNPDYNFFIHTAPISQTEKFPHYHWHFEILPKTSIWAGVELGTGIEISTIKPEEAARIIKNYLSL